MPDSNQIPFSSTDETNRPLDPPTDTVTPEIASGSETNPHIQVERPSDNAVSNEIGELRSIMVQQQTFFTQFCERQNIMNTYILDSIQKNNSNSNTLPVQTTSNDPQTSANGANVVVRDPETFVSLSAKDCRDLINAVSKRPLAISLEKTKFNSWLNDNPIIFLKRFENYCAAMKISESEKVFTVKTCFEDTIMNWMSVREETWTSYEIFRADFLRQFWSEEKQLILRERLSHRRFNDNGKLSMIEYFLSLVTQYKTFTPPLSESLIVSEVIRVLPADVQLMWTSLTDRTVDGTVEFLGRQDAIRSVKKYPLARASSMPVFVDRSTRSPVSPYDRRGNNTPGRSGFSSRSSRNIPSNSFARRSINFEPLNSYEPTNKPSSSGNENRRN